MGVNREFHVRVAGAAELGALTVIGTGLVGLQPQHIGAPRQHVQFAAEARHPERMDHIIAGQVQIHRLAGGNVQLIAQLDALLRIADLPPPLVAGHLNAQHLLAFNWQRQHAMANGDTEYQQ